MNTLTIKDYLDVVQREFGDVELPHRNITPAHGKALGGCKYETVIGNSYHLYTSGDREVTVIVYGHYYALLGSNIYKLDTNGIWNLTDTTIVQVTTVDSSSLTELDLCQFAPPVIIKRTEGKEHLPWSGIDVTNLVKAVADLFIVKPHLNLGNVTIDDLLTSMQGNTFKRTDLAVGALLSKIKALRSESKGIVAATYYNSMATNDSLFNLREIMADHGLDVTTEPFTTVVRARKQKGKPTMNELRAKIGLDLK